MFRRVLSLILCLCVLMTSMPTWSIAAALAEGEEEVVVEVISEEPEEEEEEEPTPKPTEKPTPEPTEKPTPEPTKEPTPEPTKEPTPEPTKEPTPEPTEEPTPEVTEEPTPEVTEEPTPEVTEEPTPEVTEEPTPEVTEEPTPEATEEPVVEATEEPVVEATEEPVVEATEEPVVEATEEPVVEATEEPVVEATEEPVVEATEEPRFVDGYAYVKADENVYADDELTEVLGAFAEKTVVYVSDREETADEDQDVLTLRFACEEELVKAYIAAKDVKPLDEDETADYEDEAADDGVHYEDDVYLLNAEFVFEGEETEVLESTETPVVEATEEPVVEETETPVPEVTEEPEATEIPAETEVPAIDETADPESTEIPVVEATEEPVIEAIEGEAVLDEYNETVENPYLTVVDYYKTIRTVVGNYIGFGSSAVDTNIPDAVIYLESSNPEVVRIEPDGTTCAFVGAGTAVLTVKAEGYDVSDTVDVTVLAITASLNLSAATIEVGKTLQLTLTVSPEDTKVEWIAGKTSVAEVDQTGLVTAKAVGEADIMVKLGDDAMTVSCDLTVVEASATCTHESLNAPVETISWSGAEPYWDIYEEYASYETHRGTKIKTYTTKCGDCGADVTVTETQEKEVYAAHSYVKNENDQLVCSACGYVYCEHQFAETWDAYEPIGEATATNDGNHTGMFQKVTRGDCTLCNKMIDTPVGEPEARTEPHSYNNGECMVCGAKNTCEHKNTEEAPDYDYHANEITDRKPETHTGKFYVYVVCSDCGETLHDQSGMKERTFYHAFDDNMVCYGCGYDSKCKHSETEQETEYVYSDYVDNGNGKHTVKLTKYEVTYCQDCFEPLNAEVVGEESITETHLYVDDVCDCGAKNLCKHPKPADGYPVELYIDDAVYSGKTTKTHTVSGVLVKQAYCGICGVTIGEPEIENPAYTATENHEYFNKMCACGRKNTCTHKTKATRTEEDIYSRYNYLPIAGTLAGQRHTYLANEYTDKYCKTCGEYISSTVKEKLYIADCCDADGDQICDFCGEGISVITGSGDTFEQWQMPAYVNPDTVKQPGDKQVSFSWIGDAASYKVFEQLGENDRRPDVPEAAAEGAEGDEPDKLVATVSAKSVTLKNQVLGAHTYYVVPVNGEAEGLPSNAVTWRVDPTAWKKAPVIKTAKQLTTAEGVVQLTWTHASPAESYAVYSTYTYNNKKHTNELVAVSTELSAVIENLPPVKHTFTVMPQMHNYRGELVTGTKSKTKALTVAELWKKTPTLSAAKQDTTAEGKITLTWKRASGALTEAYAIVQTVNAKKKIYKVLDVVMSDEATTTYTLDVGATGTYSLSVAAAKVVDGEVVYDEEIDGNPVLDSVKKGASSAAKSVKVTALWNKAGTITAAKQVSSAEGLVELTFKSGSALTKGWAVYAKFGTSKTAKTLLLKDKGGNDLIIPQESDSMTITKLVDVANGAGTYTFSIRPVEWDEETDQPKYKADGTPVVGTTSKTKAVKVIDYWKTAPTFVSAAQIGNNEENDAGKVELKWTIGSEFADAYAIYLTTGTGKKAKTAMLDLNKDGIADTEDVLYLSNVLTNDGKTCVYVLDDVKKGSYTYSIYPVQVTDKVVKGNASGKKTVKVDVASWADAPALKAVQRMDAEGVIKLSWSQIIGAEGFEIYEVTKDKKKKNVFTSIDGDETTPTVDMYKTEIELDVNAGAKSYAIKPMFYDEDTNEWTFEHDGLKAEMSAVTAITVKELWSQKPVIDEAVQELEADTSVVIEWKPANALSRAFVLYDNGTKAANLVKYTDKEDENYGKVIIVNLDNPDAEPKVKLDAKAGTHKYYVRPVQLDENGEEIVKYGTISAAKTVKVAALWSAKPVIKSAVQLTDAEQKVKLTFSTTAKAPDSFLVQKKVGKTWKTVIDAEEFTSRLDEENGNTVTLENGVYTVVLDETDTLEDGVTAAITAGANNIFQIVPYHNGSKGTASASKTVAVKKLWALKPTNLSAVQIKSQAELNAMKDKYPMVADSITDFEDRLVLLTWNAGSYPNMTDDYVVKCGANAKTLKELADAEILGYEYLDLEAETGLNVMLIRHEKAGTKVYQAIPQEYTVDDEGNEKTTAGTASATKSLTVADLWKTKPTITAARQYSNDEVLIEWEPGNELTTEYVITDTTGSGKKAKTNNILVPAGAGCSVVIPAAAGKHTYAVKPAVLEYNDAGDPVKASATGTASASVSVTVVDSTWSNAPTNLKAKHEAIDRIDLTWNSVVPAEDYIIYVLDKASNEFIAVDDAEDMMIYADVDAENNRAEIVIGETGEYSLAVRPMMTDSETGEILIGTMSKSVSIYAYASGDADLGELDVETAGKRIALDWKSHVMAKSYKVVVNGTEMATPTNSSCEITVEAYGTCSIKVYPVFDGGTLGDPIEAEDVVIGGPVQNVKAEYDQENHEIVVTWDAVTGDPGLRGYHIYRYDEEDGYVILTNRDNPEYRHSPIKYGEEYKFKVAAYCVTGEYELSAEVTKSVDKPTLGTVQGLTGKHFSEVVELSWDEYTEAGYEIYYEVFKNGVSLGTTTECKYSDIVDDPRAKNSYSVRACSEAMGETIYGELCAACPVDPLTPVVLEAKFDVNDGDINLNWTPVEVEDFVVEHHLERKVNGGAWQVIGKMEGSSYEDKDVVLGSTYTYHMNTYIKDEGTAWSEEVSVSTRRLGAVTGLKASYENQYVNLSWNALENVSGYEIERTCGDEVKTFKVGGPGYTDEVDFGATYVYHVRGLMGDKEGTWSSIATVKIGERPVVTKAYYSYKEGGVVIEWEPYADANNFNIMRDGVSIIDGLIENNVTRYVDKTAEFGETYSYDLNVLVDGGEISCDPAISITPQPLPKVGVSRTWYFNEQTEIDLILPENASEEFVYVVKENSAIIESKIDEQTVTVNAPDLKDHTYTVHVGVVMNDGNIMTGEGTTVTIDRGELWKLKNITDDADGVHLYWDVLADSMPTKLFVMSYDVTDADKHVNRGGAEADAESGTYVDAEAAFTGKKLGYWLEAEYRDGVNGGLLSSEGMSDCEELLPYQVRKLEKVAGLKTSYAGKMVDLIWNAQEEVPAYEIERSDDNGASYTAVATVSAEEYEANMETTEGRSAYTDTVPNFDAKYLYRVRAVAGEQAGAYSDAAVAVIGVVPKVTSAVYSHKQGGVALTWEKYTAPSDYTLDSYVILRQAEGDSEHKPYREVGAGVTTFVDGDVEVGKTYSYKVAVGMKMNPADDMITAQITSENACEVTPEALKNPGAVIPLYENTADKAKFERVDEAEYYEMYAVKDGVIGDEPVDTVKQDELRLSSSGAYVGTFRYELGDNFAEENTYVIYAVVGAVSGKKIMSSGVETTIPKRGEKPNVTGVALIEEGVEVSFDQITDANLDSITVEREDVAMLDATNGEEGREFFNGIDKQSSVYLDTTAVAGKKYVYNVVAHYGQGSIMSDSSEEYTVPTTLYTYTVENGVATVTGYLGKDVSDMEIPDTVDDKYPVRVIGNGEPFATPNAEGGLTGTLTLPEGLEEIGNCAFDGAGITGELVLPETLKTIGERAFASTGISGELVIPENVETIGAGAFNVCAGLTSVTIQGADTELGVGMLRNDWNLTTITLPEGMTTIPELFAQGNKKLTSVNIPSTVTTIGMSAFSGCTALTGTIKIPAGVTTLGAGAFGDTGYTAAEIYNKTLTEAAIADAFGKKFAGDELVACTVNLTKVCGYLGSGAYDYATNNGIEFVGIGLSDNGENFVWAEDGENAVFAGFETKPTGAVTIPATITVGDKEINVTEIGANAFSGNTAITSVTVLDGVTVIGESAFEGCTSLNSANLPDTVEIIGVRAFANCTSLSSMQ